MAEYTLREKNNPTSVYFYVVVGGLLLFLWATTYTTLKDGILTKRFLLVAIRSYRVEDIESIRPHRKNGKWSYGTVIEVWPRTGKKLVLQPNHAPELLEAL